MEDAPLTLAHSHARKAAVETRASRLDVAATEHQAAAEQFAKARHATSDVEALRMLRLLEEHHRQLAEIIRSKHTIARAMQDAPPPSPAPPLPQAPPPTRVHPSRRESSPALAKDMASRRGIPRQTSQSAPRKVHSVSASLQPSAHRRAPPSASPTSDQAPPAKDADDGFSRFYSNWTTGPLSRLSSMLAFTALPLTDTPQPDSPTSSRHEKSTVRATNEPDVNALISPAALNALQQRHGHIGPAESFYVVQDSYANIVSREQRHARRAHLSNISEEDGEFVDAQETQPPRYLQQGLVSVREEELQMQNDALKRTLDQMSHRLHAFESHAQDASMAALTQSMASVRTHSSALGAPPSKQAEDDLQAALNEIQRLRHDNAKYKSYYAKLKDSARARAEEKKKAGAAG